MFSIDYVNSCNFYKNNHGTVEAEECCQLKELSLNLQMGQADGWKRIEDDDEDPKTKQNIPL